MNTQPTLTGASVCSGIGGAEVAAPWIDWRFVAETAEFPAAVLAKRFPSVPNLGDLRNWRSYPDDQIDVLCGGTPCQSFSTLANIQGNRVGLGDDRGDLVYDFIDLASRVRARWLVWENVPGLLSVPGRGGRDFRNILRRMVERGYRVAFRIVDVRLARTARFPGSLPQRRRRLFLVGGLDSDWRDPAKVLLESSPGGGSPRAGRPAREQAPPPEDAGAAREDRRERQRDLLGDLPDPGPAVYTERGEPGTISKALTTRGVSVDHWNTSFVGEPCGGVRQLTPTEFERLQGYPDGWTRADDHRDETTAMYPRFRAIGNAWPISIAAEILERIGRLEGVFPRVEREAAA